MFFQTVAKLAALPQVSDCFLEKSLEQQGVQELELPHRQVFFKFRSTLKDNFKTDFRGEEYESVKWIQLAQWKSLVSTVITFWFS
jgi:hypothetical protein